MSTTYRCKATVHVTDDGTTYGADRDQDVHVDESLMDQEMLKSFFVGLVVEQLRAAGHEGPAVVVSYSATEVL